MSLKVINIDTPTLGDRSYLAHDGKTAVVVDPQRDIDRVQALLEQEGVTLGAVIETHMHNDYVSGGLVLAREFSAPYIVNHEDPVNFERTGVSDGQVIPVGTFAVKALHTPGHTFTHMSYELLGNDAASLGVFTGGSLLHGSTGRPDLLGPDHAPTLARLQHGSAHRLAELLEDNVAVLPTHGFGSFCAATSTSGDSSTIGDQKRMNPALLQDVETFITQTLAGLDAFPSYYKHMGPANHAGPGPIDLSELPRMSTDEVLCALNTGAWVVDLRNRNDYAKTHIPNSIAFGMDGSMATYLGWLFPYEKDLVLVGSKDDVAGAQRELVRIGIDRPKGAFVDDVASFPETKSTKVVTFSEVPGILNDPDVVVLDVRRNGERSASHIKGTLHIPLHELATRVNEVPKDKQVWVHCAGAYRASAAVGILEANGIGATLINEPYDAAMRVANMPLVTGGVDHGPVAPSDALAKAGA